MTTMLGQRLELRIEAPRWSWGFGFGWNLREVGGVRVVGVLEWRIGWWSEDDDDAVEVNMVVNGVRELWLLSVLWVEKERRDWVEKIL